MVFTTFKFFFIYSVHFIVVFIYRYKQIKLNTKIQNIIDPMKTVKSHNLSHNLPVLHSFNTQLHYSYTLTLLHSYILPILHSSNLTLFQFLTLPILHSSNPTLFQSYTLPILCSSDPILF